MSMRVPQELIPQVEKALVLSCYPSKRFLASELGLSRSTITSFFNGKAISNLNFIEICQALNLDWQDFYPQKHLSSLPNGARHNDITSKGEVNPISDSPVKIVDISFVEIKKCLEQYKNCKIDVKLRNTGEKVAYIKQADFDIKNIWYLNKKAKSIPVSSVISTQEYDINIDIIDRVPYSLSKKISQAVKPNDVDRFTFSLGRELGFLDDTIIKLVIKLIYDEDDKKSISKDLYCDFLEEPISHYFGFFSMPETRESLDKINDYKKQTIIDFHYNKRCLDQINQMDGIKSNKLERLSQIFAQFNLNEQMDYYIKTEIDNSAHLTHLFSSIGNSTTYCPF
jgi:transcriptional regulator with XRE-family HTH domain